MWSALGAKWELWKGMKPKRAKWVRVKRFRQQACSVSRSLNLMFHELFLVPINTFFKVRTIFVFSIFSIKFYFIYEIASHYVRSWWMARSVKAKVWMGRRKTRKVFADNLSWTFFDFFDLSEPTTPVGGDHDPSSNRNLHQISTRTSVWIPGRDLGPNQRTTSYQR